MCIIIEANEEERRRGYAAFALMYNTRDYSIPIRKDGSIEVSGSDIMSPGAADRFAEALKEAAEYGRKLWIPLAE